MKWKKKMRVCPQNNTNQTIKKNMVLPKMTAKTQMMDHMKKTTCSVMTTMRVLRSYKT